MALNAYITQTQLLLNDPNGQEYSTTNLTTFINLARVQIGVSVECLRYNAALATVTGTAFYPLTTLTGTGTGVAGAFRLENEASLAYSGGALFLENRPWPWAFRYWYSRSIAPAQGRPTSWSVQQPGPLGSIFLYPTPDIQYTVNFDAVGYPVTLTSDSTPEALPITWTDSVPYFAAYLAYLNAQRESDALAMMQLFERFTGWTVKQTAASVLPAYSPGGMGAAQAAQRIANTGVGMLTQGRG